MKVAFLVYKSWRQARRTDDSFDGLSNIGVYLLTHVLRKAGIYPEFCSVDSAHKFDVVLVSFTSNLDVLSFAKAVARHPNFQPGKRSFKVIAGGFGMQNPFPVKDWLDYAYFGRAESEIVDLVKNAGEIDSPHLMKLPNITPVTICQTETFFPEKFKLGKAIHKDGEGFIERSMGCPNNCFYCHYNFARKYIKADSDHYVTSLYTSSQELDMFNLDAYDPKIAQLTVGVDGYSERLRFLVNRPITNEHIKDFIIGISEKTQIKGQSVFLRLYNIIGYETESQDDFLEFKELIRETQPKIKKRILLTTHSTPLRPSPATPMAYAAVNLHYSNFGLERGKPILPEEENLLWFNSRFEESRAALLETLIVERGCEETQEIFNTIVFSSKYQGLKSNDKIRAIERSFDISPLVRAYSTDEKIPTWFLQGYVKPEKIKRYREKMLENMKKTWNSQTKKFE